VSIRYLKPPEDLEEQSEDSPWQTGKRREAVVLVAEPRKIYLPFGPDGICDEYSLEVALGVLTDEYISEGNYADQTIMDLRDALRDLLSPSPSILIHLPKE
jgi:hypothetical protein